jgi:hypothetical protein
MNVLNSFANFSTRQRQGPRIPGYFSTVSTSLTADGTGTYSVYKSTLGTFGTQSITLGGIQNGTFAEIYYVIVGGGGSGASSGGDGRPGGGGGGITTGKIIQNVGANVRYDINAGAGGREAETEDAPGKAGTASTISYTSGSLITLTALGGGGGGLGKDDIGLAGATIKDLSGVSGVTETGASTNGGSAGTKVADITGYTITIASPAKTYYFGGGGGGGNSGDSSTSFGTFGSGPGGTANATVARSGVSGTGGGGGGERGINNGQVNSANGGRGVVLLFFRTT